MKPAGLRPWLLVWLGLLMADPLSRSWAQTPPPGPPIPPAPAAPAAAPAAPAAAPVAARPESLAEAQLVDQSGKVIRLFNRVYSRWVWARLSPKDPYERPVLRTYMEFPRGVEFVSWSRPKSSSVLRLIVNPSDSPMPLQQSFDSGRWQLATDSDEPIASANLNVRIQGAPRQLSILVIVKSRPPINWIHQSCEDAGVFVLQKAVNANYLYNAAYCAETPEENGKPKGGLSVYVLHSPDAEWKSAGRLPIGKVEPGAVRFDFRDADRPVGKPKYIGWFHIVRKGPQGSAAGAIGSDHLLGLEPRKESRFTLALGLGLTSMHYSEEPIGVSLTEMAFTPKATGTYRIIPRTLVVSANVFLTALPLFNSPSTLTPAFSVGANARVGYQLPFQPWKGADLTVSTGYYFWRLTTPSGAFGLDLLAGPQLLVSLFQAFSPTRSYFAYLKYAPVSNSLATTSLSNFEGAFGGGYQLPWLWWGKSWAVTLDVARMQFAAVETANSAILHTVTLGMQVSLGFN